MKRFSRSRLLHVWLAALAAGALTDSPAAAQVDHAERIARVEAGLLTRQGVRGASGYSMEERLRFHRVPGVSVAVFEGGRVAWARGWGEAEAGSGTPVDTATLFQAASISKPVAAVGALRMVEAGQLGLDEDVNRRLRSWRIPESRLTATEKVTLRRLLSHSAGTTVHGFPGYVSTARVPTLVQLLNGRAPANTAPVRVDLLPGTRMRYSGGGTSVVQLLMTDVARKPFPDLMAELVLGPTGMRHSTYAQPLPADRRPRAATAHDRAGAPLAGRFHTYPEQAAAGLWTTPSDLARFAIAVHKAYAGDEDGILSPVTAREMLSRQAADSGLGFFVLGSGNQLRFEHTGSNAGYRAHLVFAAGSGTGAVVMTNGDGGGDLAGEILRAIAREYGLPGFAVAGRDTVALPAARLAELARPGLHRRREVFGNMSEGGPPDLEQIHVRDLENVDCYGSPSSTPLEFRGGTATCGTLVLWTPES
jgi:CubicO group peptidase (beta-lactamase class C family)